jgi:hypothetical protein
MPTARNPISGNTITVNLHILFASSIDGSHIGQIDVSSNSGGYIGPFNAGVWTVPYSGPLASITNEFLQLGSTGVGSSAEQTVTLNAGALEANFAVIQTMYAMATSGRHPMASLYWLTNRAGWNPRLAFEQQAVALPPFIVAKDDGVKKP